MGLVVRKLPEFANYNGELSSLVLNEYNPGIPALLKPIRRKRWMFAAVNSPEAVVGVALVDLGYVGNYFCYLYHKDTNTFTEFSGKPLFARHIRVREQFGHGISEYKRGDRHIRFELNPETRCETIGLSLKNRDHRMSGELNIHIPEGYQPHQVVFPSFKNSFAFTQKSAGLSASGALELDGKMLRFEKQNSFGLLDHTLGYHDYFWEWRWSALSGEGSSGERIGLNLVTPVSHPEINENVLWVDGKKQLVGPIEVIKTPSEDPACWRIRSRNQSVELTFKARRSRGEHLNAGLIMSRFSQFIGCYSGEIRGKSGRAIILKDQTGLLEDHRARW